MTLMLLILVLLVAALVVATLILGELFLFPGFGISGILGISTLFGISWYLLSIGQLSLLIAFAVACLAFFVLGFWLLSRKKVLRKISLSTSVDEVVNTIPLTITRGARGISSSRLAPGGNIRIGDHILYAESEDGFIIEGVPIYISRITNNKIYVRMDREKIYESQETNH